MMVDYTDTPFPGDYQPGQVEATPFLFQSQLPTHFSPATSDQSFQNPQPGHNRPATSTGVPGTPQLGAARTLGPGGEMNFGQQPMQPGGGGGGGHSHSFSTASLPSLASSSGSFSMPSHPDNQPGQMSMSAGPSPVAPAAANLFTGGPGPMLFNGGAQQLQHPDGSKLQVNTSNMTPNPQPMTAPPGLGLGVTMYPPTPMSGTVPPTLFSSPVVNNSNVFPPSQPNYPFMGKIHGRDRSFSRPGPYHVSSRSGSLSIKSDADDNSIYSSASNASTWSTNTTNMIAGDMGQMTLEHRRSSSTPFEIPCGGHVATRGRARSFSLGKSSTNNLDFLEADLELSGSASEREGAVRADLANKAEQVRRLSPCQHGKARAFWAKRWLKLSYTPVNGFTVPRQGLYHSYTMSCKDFGLRPINSASFGKVVRSTFLGIRTRRLGVRGNSKYHYVSLRPAISTEAQRLNAYGDSSGQLHIAPPDGDFGSEDAGEQEVLTEDDSKEDDDDDDIGHLSEGSRFGGNLFGQPGQPFPLSHRSRSSSSDDSLVIRSARPAYMVSQSAPSGISGVTTGAPTGVQLNGGHSVPPPFPVLPANSNPNAMAFWNRFVQQQDTLAQCVADHQFDQFDSNYRTFWDQTPADQLQAASQPPVSTMMADATAMSFDHCILKLVDNILQPIKPQAHASLSLLALNFGNMVSESLALLPPDVSGPLVELGNHCSQLISRILNLYQITSAINPILSDPDHLATMISSWQQTVDSNYIIKQTAETCDCGEPIVEAALLSFQSWLFNLPTCYNTYHPIEKLAEVVDSALDDIPNASPRRSIVPKGAYLTSQVMRLLTLKSDISFGWFQLLKTWIDDYLQISCYRHEVFCPKNPPSALAASPSHIKESPTLSTTTSNPTPNPPSSTTVDPNTMIAGVGAAGVGIGIGQSSSSGSSHSHSHSHSGPNLAIDTVTANYNSANALDVSAITPRPAFTQSGMATSATGPGVGGIAGPSGNSNMGGYL